MRKAIAILSLAVYLFGTTEAYQLLKLPELMKHFAKHRREEPSITFLAFLQEHYSDKCPHADRQHRQLPFKANHNNCAFSIVLLVPPAVETAGDAFDPAVMKYASHNDDAFLPGSFHTIFQPPRA